MLKDVFQQKHRQDVNGILYFYDINRNKWLSNREILTFDYNHKNISKHRYLKFNSVFTNNGGFRIIRDATITSLCVQTGSISTGTFQIQVKRGAIIIDLLSVSLNSEIGNIFDNINLDIQQSDVLIVKIISGVVDYPVVGIELSWRTTF